MNDSYWMMLKAFKMTTQHWTVFSCCNNMLTCTKIDSEWSKLIKRIGILIYVL